ncbi:MAG: hypothetical protein LBB72_09405 [Spirochaetaceae bacterium]|jgi:hypothetical protein|nr:hypothetical protein [Spirochaetaceae bacterium]
MSFFKNNLKSKVAFPKTEVLEKPPLIILFAVISVCTVVLSTCGSPLGFGRQIDWEPPVLTMDKVQNPLYVRNGEKLTGTVKDNVGVSKVVMTDSVTGEELLTAVINGDRWEIELMFDESRNGEKIMAQISAYDNIGNCGADSIAFVTLIIDIRPPIVENISIQRTDTRPSRLEPYPDLKELETLDPKGEKKDNLYRYQNGWFYVDAMLNDEETRIESVKLKIYDYKKDIDFCLKVLEEEDIVDDRTYYFPRWLVKEEEIIEAGAAKWGAAYRTNYYDNGERYYYRIVVEAIDKSKNITEIVEEDEGYICMWALSDDPKGVLDPAIRLTVLQDIEDSGTENTISRGTPLPVDFYDDDSLLWAYAGLFTQEQWNGQKDVYSGGIKIQGANDNAKVAWLKQRLTGTGMDSLVINDTAERRLYNWQYDKYELTPSDQKDMEIKQLIDNSIDEKLVYVQTGNKEGDYGDYVLFTMAADNKLSPHTGEGPNRTNKNVWTYKVWKVKIVDENAPLIVFDKENGCPEENTFPSLADGASFTIKGYTLRENQTGQNGVKVFRMAWIPFRMPDGADNYITRVQNALKASSYPASFDAALAGVQHWEFQESGGPGSGFAEGKFDPNADTFPGDIEVISTTVYRNQKFEKTFNVMDVPDDIKSSYKNFTYNGDLENETKLFIFYAQDNMGHDVFRQLRLLGMKTPPNLTVSDLTHKIDVMPEVGGKKLPNPNDVGYPDDATGGFTPAYYAALNAYNSDSNVYNAIKAKSAAGDLSTPFSMYPRETIVKYWITASKGGDIAVKSISMKDITLSDKDLAPAVGSGYNGADEAFSFCEYFPDIAQRTFLFEAEDMLGNVAMVQRTIAVTNAARLENITTTSQSGTYGIGEKITLKANFSGQIYVPNGYPQINVRYLFNGTPQYRSIICNSPPTKANPALSLDFEFVVEEGFGGLLETMYEDISGYPPGGPPPSSWYGGRVGGNVPITLPVTYPETTIMDNIRNSQAFIPGGKSESVTMPNWTTDDYTLQKKKDIGLDGTRPKITVISADANGKAAYSPNQFYVKTGETINFTLTADKQIRASDTVPRLQYQIRQGNSNLGGPYSTAFTYSRPNGQNALVFSLPINATSCPVDGELVNVSLYTGTDGGTILDNVDNTVDLTTVTSFELGSTRFFIKKSISDPPTGTIGSSTLGVNPNTPILFNTNPTLTINASAFSWNGTPAPEGGGNWENSIEYSINGGGTWIPYTDPVLITASGTSNLRARYKDRAGNEGTARSQVIQLNSTFPNLVSVGAAQANGSYRAGSTLTFNLNFADTVRVTNAANVTITLRNRAAASADEATYITLPTNTAANTNVTTVTFNWQNITNKEMRDGLYISAVNLNGLTDLFGSLGPSGTAAWNSGTAGNISVSNCPNLAAGIIVDAIAPSVTARTPQHNTAPAATDPAVSSIMLTFREPVMKGGGTITIRPRGNYAIPPVLEDSGYYLGTDGNRYSASGVNRTYISSFYDIYNALPAGSVERGYLAQGSSMSDLTLNARTGQNAGPYIKMTHGLVEGYGYTGNYSGTITNNAAASANSPNLGGTGAHTAMIPDTATKWVLDYQYGITQNVTAVNNIRAALTRAKWRWQEIDVVNTTVGGTNNTQVTIPLSEPLLKGLEWDVYYPAGAFTDMAGNNAPASDNTTYYFTSPGVQAPVIRVNRRSYDAKNEYWEAKWTLTNTTATWDGNNTKPYNPPPNSADWSAATSNFAVNGVAGDNGWGIKDFDTVHYRVESESPNAAVTAQYYQGADSNGGGVTAAWAGSVADSNTGTTLQITPMTWNQAAGNTPGEWVLSNLIRRSRNNADQTYTVITKNSTPESRTSVGTLRMFRSYNRDLTKAQLDGTGLSGAILSGGQSVLTFNSLEASKSYIVGTAILNGANAKGYEGVYRTVIALNYGTNRGRYFAVQGSNIKNGMPSIAGFPVRDAEETGDNRYNKVFYNDNDDAGPYQRFYWVSTEIVCEWYFLTWGGRSRATGTNADSGVGNGGNNNGTHQTPGEVNNYLMIGYGDLTYGYNISCGNGTNW